MPPESDRILRILYVLVSLIAILVIGVFATFLKLDGRIHRLEERIPSQVIEQKVDVSSDRDRYWELVEKEAERIRKEGE